MKKIKYVFELIFTFLLPVIAMFLCFEIKIVNTVDENNNVVATEKEFNFKDFDFFNSEEVTYFNYVYYDQDEILPNYTNILIDFNNYYSGGIYTQQISSWYSIFPNYLFRYYTSEENYYLYSFGQVNQSNRYDVINLSTSSITSTYQINYSENKFYLYANNNNVIYSMSNNFLVKSIESKTLKENFISRLLHNLFDSIGIENNVVIEVIIIYLLLTLIMFIFWNLIYYPLSIVFNIMLWKKELF